MGKDDIHKVYNATSDAKIVVSHMEAVNHYTLTRSDLKNYLNDNNLNNRVYVPNDGEVYNF